jgi:hypothetical protein
MSARRAWSSPLYLRAQQTAEPLLARYPATAVEEAAVQEFMYLAPAKCVNTDTAPRKPLVDDYWAQKDPNHCDEWVRNHSRSLLGRVQGFLARAGWRCPFGSRAKPGAQWMAALLFALQESRLLLT